MSEVIIQDSEPIDIVADASLDGATIDTQWRDGELWAVWRRDGKILGGLVLSAEHAEELAAALHTATLDKSLFSKEEQ